MARARARAVATNAALHRSDRRHRSYFIISESQRFSSEIELITLGCVRIELTRPARCSRCLRSSLRGRYDRNFVEHSVFALYCGDQYEFRQVSYEPEIETEERLYRVI